jgi:hypothetical protein
VVYALHQSAPPIFSKSTETTGNTNYLKTLKSAEDWDRTAGSQVFPGLKQKIESYRESIQVEVASVLSETLEDGRLWVTSLIKECCQLSDFLIHAVQIHVE